MGLDPFWDSLVVPTSVPLDDFLDYQRENTTVIPPSTTPGPNKTPEGVPQSGPNSIPEGVSETDFFPTPDPTPEPIRLPTPSPPTSPIQAPLPPSPIEDTVEPELRRSTRVRSSPKRYGYDG